MSVLAEKLQSAGFNAEEAALMSALSRYLNNGGSLGRLQEIMEAVALRMKKGKLDLGGAKPTPALGSLLSPIPEDQWKKSGLVEERGGSPRMQNVKPYKPREALAERIERLRPLQEIIRSKFKTSDGRHWSDITPHEANAMSRDGVEAKALLAAIPVGQPNDGKSFGDILGVKGVDRILSGN